MRAHRVRVRVSEDHELHLTLPSDFPAGDAEVIVLEVPRVDPSKNTLPKSSVDELLACRLRPPDGTAPVTLEDMERAIAEGARGSGGL
jgi:hypothetical protein